MTTNQPCPTCHGVGVIATAAMPCPTCAPGEPVVPPTSRWTVDQDDDPVYVNAEGHETFCIERQLPGRPNADRAEAVDALAALIRAAALNAADQPDAEQVHLWLIDRYDGDVNVTLAAIREVLDARAALVRGETP